MVIASNEITNQSIVVIQIIRFLRFARNDDKYHFSEFSYNVKYLRWSITLLTLT